MIIKQHAKILLEKYTKPLARLQTRIEAHGRKYYKHDPIIIPNLIAALNAIACGKKRFRILKTPGPSKFGIFINEPNIYINSWVSNDLFRQAFEKLITADCNPEDQLLLQQFLHELAHVIVLYKTEQELAVQFPTPAMRDIFIEMIGGVQKFSNEEQYSTHGNCPLLRDDSNYDTLFIPTTTASNGKLAAVFANQKQINLFVEVLGLKNRVLESGEPFMAMDSGQDVLYFNDPNLRFFRDNIYIMAPEHLYNDKVHNSYQEISKNSHALYKASRGKQSDFFFKQLPTPINIFIAALTGDGETHDASQSQHIATLYYK